MRDLHFTWLPTVVAIICHRYRNATELNLSNVPNTCMLAREAMASLRLFSSPCPCYSFLCSSFTLSTWCLWHMAFKFPFRHLETLILERGVFSYKFFHALSACPALSTLSISEATIYDEDKGIGDYNIFIHHDRLHDLRILKCFLVCVSLRWCYFLLILKEEMYRYTPAKSHIHIYIYIIHAWICSRWSWSFTSHLEKLNLKVSLFRNLLLYGKPISPLNWLTTQLKIRGSFSFGTTLSRLESIYGEMDFTLLNIW